MSKKHPALTDAEEARRNAKVVFVDASDILIVALEASVPFAIYELLCANGGHITEHDIQQAKTHMEIIASKGDNILYSGQKKERQQKHSRHWYVG